MSTVPESAPIKVTPRGDEEVRIYSHSSLFYWWPVWAVGFIMALLTLADGSRMALVPHGTKAEAARDVTGSGTRDVLIVPEGKKLPKDKEGNLVEPGPHMANSAKLGVIYATVLLIIIVVSNVPLRGLWSIIIILGIVLLVLILSLWGLWDDLVRVIKFLDIRINLGGYLFISSVLFIIWAVTVFIFDHL